MQVGIIGLGRMGANIATRLVRGGHQVVGYDHNPDAVAHAAAEGVLGLFTLDALLGKLTPPRVVWLMLPAGQPTADIITELFEQLAPGDIIVDGGNSHYQVSMAHAQTAQARGLEFLDVGTSGGLWGLAKGFCLMVGGDGNAVQRLEPLLSTLAVPKGYGHVGPSGAGHFAKMVHNGIEYGLLAAYGEGFEILEQSVFPYSLHQVAKLWMSGSVIRSWLLELIELILRDDPLLETVAGYVEDSGEGRWAVETAIAQNVPAPVITLALVSRLVSRQDESFSAKLIAALRHEFGGHPARPPAAGPAAQAAHVDS